MRDIKILLGLRLFDIVPEPVFALDPGGRFLLVNRAASRYLGRPPEEIVGRSVRELFPAEQAERQIEVIRRVVETGEPFLEERVTPVGDERFVFQYAVHRLEGPSGQPLGVLGMVRDVTALVTLERCYAELYERATDALFGIDRQGRLRVLNRQAEELSGYTREQLENLHFSQVVPPDEVERLQRYFKARLEGRGAPTQYEVRYVHASGEERWAEVHISRETSSVGTFQASVRDITDRKRLEALRKEFLHMIGHDIKAPLAVIQGFASALESGMYGELAGKQGECVQQILEASRRLRRLVEQFLLAERLAEGAEWVARPGPAAGVFQSCARTFRLQAEREGVEFHASCGVPPSVRVADAEGLRHVLDNLAANALKFTPRGGRVDLRLDLEGNQVRLEVRDNGRGIPEKDLKRLFEKFFRASNAGGTAGSGLGLYIVRRLVERAGGVLRVESREGQGTRFTVWLPVEDADGGGKEASCPTSS